MELRQIKSKPDLGKSEEYRLKTSEEFSIFFSSIEESKNIIWLKNMRGEKCGMIEDPNKIKKFRDLWIRDCDTI